MNQQNSNPRTVFVISLILTGVVSASLIFYNFLKLPKYLDLDEVEFARLALDLQNKPYTPYHQYATGHTTFYYYLILASFKLFSPSNFSLRLVSAMFGVLSALALAYLAKQIKTKNKEFIIFFPLVVITQRWFFNFARFSFEATFLLFWEILSIIFLFNFLKTNKAKHIMISALFAGLAYNSYAAGRVFFLIPIIVVFLAKIKRKTANLALFLLIFLLTTAPLNLYFFNNTLDTRAQQQVFLFNTQLSLTDKLLFIKDNLIKYTQMFFTQGDVNGRHNYPLKPAVNILISLTFTLGLCQSLKKIIVKTDSSADKVFLVWFGVTLALPILTYPWENPNMLRTYFILPALGYFSYSGLELLIDKFKLNNKKFIIFSAFMLLSAVYDLRTYFYYQAQVFDYAFKVTEPLEVIYKTDGLKLLYGSDLEAFKQKYNY